MNRVPPERWQRDWRILDARRLGKTYAAVGEEFNLSSARIRDIVLRMEKFERYGFSRERPPK